MKNLYMIACVSEDLGLGRDGDLLWQIPEDMQFFRKTTTNSIVVMGKRTYESIGRALPKRENIVLSHHQVNDSAVKTYADVSELRKYLSSSPGKKFIIGGAALYKLFLNGAEKLYLTEVDSCKSADTFFPEFDKKKFIRLVLKSGEYNGTKYNIVEYTRKVDE